MWGALAFKEDTAAKSRYFLVSPFGAPAYTHHILQPSYMEFLEQRFKIPRLEDMRKSADQQSEGSGAGQHSEAERAAERATGAGNQRWQGISPRTLVL